jgi:esterase/lipase superfamily enzyme
MKTQPGSRPLLDAKRCTFSELLHLGPKAEIPNCRNDADQLADAPTQRFQLLPDLESLDLRALRQDASFHNGHRGICMAHVLIVYASDAEPIIEVLDASLSKENTVFYFDVDRFPSSRMGSALRFAQDRVDVCVVLTSSWLLHRTRNILRLGRFGGGQRHRDLTDASVIQLNLHRPKRSERSRWRRGLGSEYDPVFAGEPLLDLPAEELGQRLLDLGQFLSRYPGRRERFTGPSSDQLSRSSLPYRAFLRSDPRIVELLFATNRVSVGGPSIEDFSGERASGLTFGITRVRVPEDHKIGRLELPQTRSWLRFRFSDEKVDEQRHFVIREIGVVDRKGFTEVVERDPTHTAIVFIHGFNTSFKDSVLRFSQIIWDMQFKSLPILFSWPSRGGVLNYLYDLNSALDARRWFSELVQLLCTEARVTTLHIIAHSMGNFLVLDALNNLAQAGAIPQLSEVIMAAPDVDVDLFRSWAVNIRPAARGMTLYASGSDKALSASRNISKKQRAGDVFADGPMMIPNVDSIDVSSIGVEMFGLSHNVFAADRSLIDDIGRLLLTGARPPNLRSPQIRGVPEGQSPPRYWRYGA